MSNQFLDNRQIFYSSRYENVAKNGLIGLFMTDCDPKCAIGRRGQYVHKLLLSLTIFV